MTKWQSFWEGFGFGPSIGALKVYSELSDEEVKIAAAVLVKAYDEELPKLSFSFRKWHLRRRIWRRLLAVREDMKRRGGVFVLNALNEARHDT